MTPPGWYTDAQGQRRWWDGNAWTPHVTSRRESEFSWVPWTLVAMAVALVLAVVVGLLMPGEVGDDLRDSFRDVGDTFSSET